MNLERFLGNLLKAGKLKKQSTDIYYLNNLLYAAERNFRATLFLKEMVSEASFRLFYDGLLQLGRVILLINGYRPDDGEQHKTTFSAAGEFLGSDFADLIRRIQRFRVKRNVCLYDPTGLISKEETESIYETAQKFWERTRKYLQNKNPQLDLFDDF